MDLPAEQESLRLIESQHQGLFAQFHELERLIGSPEEHTKFLSALEALADSISEHFEYEEQFMIACGYDSVGGHKWQHETLLEDMCSLLTAARMMPRAAPEAILVMRRIVQEHTEEADADFLEYLRRRT